MSILIFFLTLIYLSSSNASCTSYIFPTMMQGWIPSINGRINGNVIETYMTLGAKTGRVALDIISVH